MYQDPLVKPSVIPCNALPSAGSRPLRVGLLGLGTVGGGTYQVLRRNSDLIFHRAGRYIQVTMVAARNRARAASVVHHDVVVLEDPFEVVRHPDIDVIVEAIGGTTTARELVLQAIASGKHVVTANKALLALHGHEIFGAAQAQGVIVAYEGAVAVSIPIIKVLREGLAGNRIEWLAGIINGTSNFILSEMNTKELSFDAALADAQSKGYAEQDPSFDVDGVDAAHKLTLLASNAFGIPLQFDRIFTEGIRTIESRDVEFAECLGFRVKLLAIAQRTAVEGNAADGTHAMAGIALAVQPALIPKDHLLAQVHGSMNAVMVKSDAAGVTLFYGAGAGSEPTASAVIADLVDISRTEGVAPSRWTPHLGFQSSATTDQQAIPPDDVVSGYYLRLNLHSGSWFPSDLDHLFSKAGLRIVQQQLFAHPGAAKGQSIVILCSPTSPRVLCKVMAEMTQLPWVDGAIRSMRIAQLETLDGV